VDLDQNLEGIILDSVGAVDGGASFRGGFLRVTFGHDGQGKLLGALLGGALDREALTARNVFAELALGREAAALSGRGLVAGRRALE
jgi:hypothetical protein